MTELRSLIVLDARVGVSDILSIHCGVVELTERFDVDALASGDVLVVRLRTAPNPPAPVAPPAAAVQVAGHKRGAEDSAAATSLGSGGVVHAALLLRDDQAQRARAHLAAAL